MNKQEIIDLMNILISFDLVFTGVYRWCLQVWETLWENEGIATGWTSGPVIIAHTAQLYYSKPFCTKQFWVGNFRFSMKHNCKKVDIIKIQSSLLSI